MALDHIGFAVRDFPASRAFYLAALAPLGYVATKEGENWMLIGSADGHELWFGAADVAGQPPGHIHFAFAAEDHEAVRAFHTAALAAGGTDNGGPGYRPQYHTNYFAAFVIDPDGHNVEAVCHAPGKNQDQ
ncbi:VOC family protein [Roseomonas sp. CCTCC AB2023176]|uniref:VOC family protein n=1 Tax=Roseomonas sp. CCTCC AB2023176 TaxID=3342640 RepID=UPI0035D8B484